MREQLKEAEKARANAQSERDRWQAELDLQGGRVEELAGLIRHNERVPA
jgi:hypothetical protein